MLTLPSVHPFLMALLREGQTEKDQLAAFPHHSWETIIEEAIAQRIAAILFRWLNNLNHQHLIPIHLLNLLTQQMVRQTAWNLLLTKELGRILAACQERGIACIPIRGPMFAVQLYGDCSMRRMDDLDLLVHREDLSAIKEIFDRLGYAPHEQRPGFLEAYSYSLEFIHPRHGVIVEPHWTLVYPPFVATAAMEPVWARAVRQRLMNIDTWTLSQADLVLHLCLHLLHKGEHTPLLWYYELDTLIRRKRSPLDWNVFVQQAQAMGQAGLIADVLATLMHHFNSTIPDSTMSRLLGTAQPTPSIPPHQMRDHLLAQSSLNGREEFALLCSLRGLRPKIQYVYALLFPSPEYMAQRYGMSSSMGLTMSYIARACHLSWEGCKWTGAWLVAAVTTRRG
ncbi:MAG: nucleotidyltransferase family protein [Nitrospirota bacterium]|nr:nucleotidyltransferase family protein [Nitrospirota bacterium]